MFVSFGHDLLVDFPSVDFMEGYFADNAREVNTEPTLVSRVARVSIRLRCVSLHSDSQAERYFCRSELYSSHIGIILCGMSTGGDRKLNPTLPGLVFESRKMPPAREEVFTCSIGSILAFYVLSL